jgi:hypothetical protein
LDREDFAPFFVEAFVNFDCVVPRDFFLESEVLFFEDRDILVPFFRENAESFVLCFPLPFLE